MTSLLINLAFSYSSQGLWVRHSHIYPFSKWGNRNGEISCDVSLAPLLSPPLTPPSSRAGEDSFMYLLITLQLAGPALREQGTRQVFQSHLCLGTDLWFPITAPWRFLSHFPGVGPDSSCTNIGDTEHHFLCSVPSVAFRSHSSWPRFSLSGTRHYIHHLFSCLYSLINKELNLILSCFSLLASNSLSSISLFFTPFPLLLVSLHDNTCSLSSCSLCSLHLSLSPFPSPSMWALGFVFW